MQVKGATGVDGKVVRVKPELSIYAPSINHNRADVAQRGVAGEAQCATVHENITGEGIVRVIEDDVIKVIPGYARVQQVVLLARSTTADKSGQPDNRKVSRGALQRELRPPANTKP